MRVAVTVFVSLLLAARAASPATLRIPVDFATIQGGLDAAAPGDTVLVADGTYTGDGNRDLDFHGKSLVLISASGDPAQCKIDIAGSNFNLHRGFDFHLGEARSAKVVGLGISRGYLASTTYLSYTGGGVLCRGGASPTFVNCVIEHCWAGDQEFGLGGGVACLDGTSPLFEDCVIRGNAGGNAGGGIFTNYASPEFSGCTISGNSVPRGQHIGGGAFCRWPSSPRFRNCVFSQNDVTQNGDIKGPGDSEGGGAFVYANCSPIFEGCHFVGNTAYGGGAGVSCRDNSNAVFTDCVFEANATTGGSAAGALARGGSSPQLARCTFIRNQSAQHGGGVYLMESNHSVLTDCVFFENHAAGHGGGIELTTQASPRMIGCTVVRNSADQAGSGIHAYPNCTLTLDRCLIAFNLTHTWIASDGTITASCCDVYGNDGGDSLGIQLGVNGNFSADPRFCDISNGTLSVSQCSPCLPGQHPGGGTCGQIGAYGVGCSGPTPVTRTSWGRLKSLYR